MARIKKVKETIRLRTKKLSNGNLSLYLDYYEDGVREYEFLKLYLIPERTAADKLQNEGTLRTANLIKAKKIISTQNEGRGFKEKTNGNVDFLMFMEKQADGYKERGSIAHSESVRAAIEHLKAYTKKESILLKKVDKTFLKGFIDYLNKVKSKRGKVLSEGTRVLYYSIITTSLNKAVNDGLILVNPTTRIESADRPKHKESTKQYLTFDEVKVMIDAPCENEIVKRAFLFSCFCGLRYSDVKKLTWKDIQEVENNTFQVEITQQKTKETLYLPLSDNALTWLPERGLANDSDKVFKLPSSPTTIEKHLGVWAESAGIKKHITYHCSRHTHAVLMLYFGADIYTVSKLLGHTNVKTTQVYAKIVDESKRKAVNLIPNIKI